MTVFRRYGTHERKVPLAPSSPVDWQCQAIRQARFLGAMVAVRCMKHFRHGNGPRNRGRFTKLHAAYFPDDPDMNPVRWYGTGQGTEEQEDVWERAYKAGLRYREAMNYTLKDLKTFLEKHGA